MAASRRLDWLALAVIAVPFAIGWALVSPRQDVPVIDDWVYAWSVEHLLKTGQLRVPDFSSVYPIAQILWGALFARVAGFSFVALRLSTVVLAVFGCWAIYLTLNELALNRTVSLMIGGDLHPSAWSARITPVLKVIGTIVVASLIAGLWSIRRSDWREGRVIVAAGVLHVALINILWAYNDRYYLVLLPTMAYLAAPFWMAGCAHGPPVWCWRSGHS